MPTGITSARRSRLARDLAQMREIGLNVVRIYHAPPLWFLDRCAAAGMRVLITLPWAKHIEFLREKRRARRDRRIGPHGGGRACRSSGDLRLSGRQRNLEHDGALARRAAGDGISSSTSSASAREADPNVLFSYASYPPTEFLLPQNVDFFCFNVYLHNQRDFERYLLRLQNLAEERPLMLGEFGMDTIRHSEDEQAEMLGWHVDSVVQCGLAGTIFFAWTDEWFTGEQEITDWAFGLVTRDARAEESRSSRLREKLGQDDAALPHRASAAERRSSP